MQALFEVPLNADLCIPSTKSPLASWLYNLSFVASHT